MTILTHSQSQMENGTIQATNRQQDFYFCELSYFNYFNNTIFSRIFLFVSQGVVYCHVLSCGGRFNFYLAVYVFGHTHLSEAKEKNRIKIFSIVFQYCFFIFSLSVLGFVIKLSPPSFPHEWLLIINYRFSGRLCISGSGRC